MNLPNITPIQTKLAEVPKPAQAYGVVTGARNQHIVFSTDTEGSKWICECRDFAMATRIAQLLYEAQKPEPPF